MTAWFDWLGPDGGRSLLWALLLALLVFWIVGAYNRLTRLRGAIGVAWAQIDELLSRRSMMLRSLVESLQQPLADEAPTLAALSAAEQRQHQATLAVRARPSQAVPLTAWVVAEGELASPLARLLALLEQRSDLAHDDTIAPVARQLAELAPRLAYARQMFGTAADQYNEALQEFPTRWVAAAFSMRPAPRL